MIARIAVLLVLAPILPAMALDRCTPALPVHTVCECRLADLHPTQTAVGLQRIGELKQEGFARLSRSAAKDGNHAEIVIGPGGGFYLVDGHHHARAMSDLQPAGSTTCEIAGSAQDLPAAPAAFWAGMEARGFARLKGPDGADHPGVFPPATLAGMGDDPFRYIAGWVEYACRAKLEGDFAEFRLADLLRADPANPTPHDPAAVQRSKQEALTFIHDPANRAALSAIPGGQALIACR